MKNRFKFRVWQTELKEPKMKYNSGLVINNNEIIEDGCVVMQCTGLKDKNGKLIYEGDIIQIQGDTGKAKVEYSLEKGMFLLIGKKYAPSAFMTIRKDYWEVIGNIYENPDLLQECE